MDNLPEENMWSFVIRIWLEEINEENQPHWRGHITHINGNERRYFDDLEDMKRFVKTFLETTD